VGSFINTVRNAESIMRGASVKNLSGKKETNQKGPAISVA